MVIGINQPAAAKLAREFDKDIDGLKTSRSQRHKAITASGKTTEEFMTGIYRGPGKIGVVTDGRCEYCKAGLPVPPEMY